ncbi:MAG: hypothetical protein LBJ11_04560 [Oscillospiraceae bacterium]|nr:hypothetical protein [Oscillospiraceae bacterium]
MAKTKAWQEQEFPETDEQPRRHWLWQALTDNPLLVQAAGICPIAVAAATIRGGLLVAIITAAQLLLCELLTSLLLKKLPGWLRAAGYFAIGLGVICGAFWFSEALSKWTGTDSQAVRTVGVFLPLLAANSAVALRCEHRARQLPPGEALRDAAAAAAGYGFVAILIGTVRELLGWGSFWGRPFTEVQVRGIWMPFGGLLLLGALAALLKQVFLRLEEKGRLTGAAAAMEFQIEDWEVRRQRDLDLLDNGEAPSADPHEGTFLLLDNGMFPEDPAQMQMTQPLPLFLKSWDADGKPLASGFAVPAPKPAPQTKAPPKKEPPKAELPKKEKAPSAGPKMVRTAPVRPEPVKPLVSKQAPRPETLPEPAPAETEQPRVTQETVEIKISELMRLLAEQEEQEMNDPK